MTYIVSSGALNSTHSLTPFKLKLNIANSTIIVVNGEN